MTAHLNANCETLRANIGERDWIAWIANIHNLQTVNPGSHVGNAIDDLKI